MNVEAPQLIAVVGVALPLLVQALKGLWPKIDPRVWSIGISVFVGLLYALAQEFVPEEFFAQLCAVGGTTFAIGTGLYRLSKPSAKK